MLAGHADGSATLWNAISQELVHNVHGHSDAVVSLATSPDGQQILTGSQTMADLWDASNGRETSPSSGRSECAGFQP